MWAITEFNPINFVLRELFSGAVIRAWSYELEKSATVGFGSPIISCGFVAEWLVPVRGGGAAYVLPCAAATGVDSEHPIPML